MNCPNCGAEVKPGARFCTSCGTAMPEAAPVAQAAPAAPPPAASPSRVPTAPSPAPKSELAATGLEQLFRSSLETDTPDAFSLQHKKLLKVNMQASGGQVLCKAGSMIAYQGQMTFERLGSGGAAKFLKKKLTGEELVLMQVSGTGDLFLADAANDIALLYLNNESIQVETLNLLAFSPSIDWDIVMIKGAAGMMTGGLFTLELQGTGYVALMTKGEPLTLRVKPGEITMTDPNATVAWSAGLIPEVHMEASFKSLAGILGSRHGELFQLKFQGDGYVIVQPSEVAPTTSLQQPGGGGSGGVGGVLGGLLK